MAFFSFLYRHGLWVGPLAFAAGVFCLGQCIAGLVRTSRQARLVAAPFVANQEVDLPEAGPVVLAMETPIFSGPVLLPFRGLEFELLGPDGAPAPRRTTFHGTTKGFSRSTTDLREFDVALPGRHRLQVQGLGDYRGKAEDVRLLLSRPHFGRSLALVLGVVGTAVVTIGSVVLFFLRLFRVAS